MYSTSMIPEYPALSQAKSETCWTSLDPSRPTPNAGSLVKMLTAWMRATIEAAAYPRAAAAPSDRPGTDDDEPKEIGMVIDVGPLNADGHLFFSQLFISVVILSRKTERERKEIDDIAGRKGRSFFRGHDRLSGYPAAVHPFTVVVLVLCQGCLKFGVQSKKTCSFMHVAP